MEKGILRCLKCVPERPGLVVTPSEEHRFSCFITLCLPQDGKILRHGNAKAVSLDSVALLDAVLGGRGNENDPAVANTSSKTPDMGNTSSTPTVECEGGVCKLVRKKKPEVSKEATAATAGKEGTGPATHVVQASAVDRTVDCEGGVCKLTRKKGEERGGTSVPAAPKASVESQDSTVAGGAPHAVARSIECEGSVCKLVRKQKRAGFHEEADRAEKENGFQESLRVGDAMPSLLVRNYADACRALGFCPAHDIRLAEDSIIDVQACCLLVCSIAGSLGGKY